VWLCTNKKIISAEAQDVGYSMQEAISEGKGHSNTYCTKMRMLLLSVFFSTR